MERQDTGFSLIEVLISLVVVSVGLLALSDLQISFRSAGAEAKARSLAASLAREKLDDLRGFQQLEAGGAGRFGFDEITDSSGVAVGGGSENGDGSLKLPEGSVSLSGISLHLQWRVNDYYLPPPGAASKTPTATWESTAWGTPPARPDFKQVTVTIRWGGGGDRRTYSLTGTIAAISPAASGRTVISPPAPQLPRVPYDPAEAPEGVSFKEGDTYRQTPPPRTSSTPNAGVTRIDQVRYGEDLTVKTRSQLVTVDCECRQREEHGDTFTPTVPGPDGPQVGEPAFKRYGLEDRSAEQQQTEYCALCCRDHHDVLGRPRFDPFRPTDARNYPANLGGDHRHAYPSSDGTLLPADDAGAPYLESCRLTYVDGRLRVFQDWYLARLTILPAGWLESGENRATYSAYVGDFLDAYIEAIEPSRAPACDGGSADYFSYSQPEIEAENGDLPREAVVSMGSTAQFDVRAIYIDHMPSEFINEIKCRKRNGRPYRQLIPYYELRVTELADWGPGSLRGILLEAGDLKATGAAPEQLLLTATLRLSNTGLTGGPPIDSDDQRSRQATLEVNVVAAPNT